MNEYCGEGTDYCLYQLQDSVPAVHMCFKPDLGRASTISILDSLGNLNPTGRREIYQVIHFCRRMFLLIADEFEPTVKEILTPLGSTN